MARGPDSSQRAVWEVIRINYSRSITRAIKVRAKRLLITKEANLSVSLAHPSQPYRILVSCVSPFSLFNRRRRLGRDRRLFGSHEIPLRILLLERVCVTVISVATLSRLSGAFPPPNSRAPRDGRSRGKRAAGTERGLDISGVLSVISLVLLLPPNSPYPPTLVAPFTRSEPAHVHPRGLES